MRLFLVLYITFAGATTVFSQAARLESEFQSWNEIQLILPLVTGKNRENKSIDKITATFNGTARVGRNNLDFLDNRVGATVDFRVNKYLTLLTAVLYRRDELVKNVTRYETRFDAGAVFSKTLCNVSFRNRNMFEHRFRAGRGDTNLYRNRTQISRPLKYKNKELFTPFVSEEGYYEVTGKKWISNEFYAGITRRINRKTSIDIAYLRLDAQPVNVNGISLNLKIRLK